MCRWNVNVVTTVTSYDVGAGNGSLVSFFPTGQNKNNEASDLCIKGGCGRQICEMHKYDQKRLRHFKKHLTGP